MTVKKATKVLVFLSVLWMGVIFFLSAQPKENSSAVSNAVTAAIVDVMYGDSKPDTAEEAGVSTSDELIVKDIENGLVPKDDILGRNKLFFKSDVRKFAHMVIFFVLAVLVNLCFVSHFGKNKVKYALSTLAICALYACLDELHQNFVPGRGAQITDVGLDCIGVLAGLAVIILAMGIVKLVKTTGKKVKTA